MKFADDAVATRPVCTAPYAQYEHYKAIWKSNNFPYTPQEYEAAMRVIALECGV